MRERLDASLVLQRLERAVRLREALFPDPARTDGFRLINGEGDGLPGACTGESLSRGKAPSRSLLHQRQTGRQVVCALTTRHDKAIGVAAVGAAPSCRRRRRSYAVVARLRARHSRHGAAAQQRHSVRARCALTTA